VLLASFGPDCGSHLIWAGILEIIHLPTFLTPALMMVRTGGKGLAAIILPAIGLISILLNPLFGIILPFFIVYNTDPSDPSSCCWTGPDATPMGAVQFLLIANTLLYIPTVVCVAASYATAFARRHI